MKIIKKDSIKKILNQLKINDKILDTIRKKQSIIIRLDSINKSYRLQLKKGYNNCIYYQLLKF